MDFNLHGARGNEDSEALKPWSPGALELALLEGAPVAEVGTEEGMKRWGRPTIKISQDA